MRMPVCRSSSIIAEILASVRHASRKALYSILESTLGGLTSYRGWAMFAAGFASVYSLSLRNRKKDLMELIFREIDLAV